MEKRKKKLRGIVVSDRAQKSIVVEVSTKKKHPTYGKQIIWSKKYMVHDENNDCKTRDVVEIVESRPYSKKKVFKVSRIINKAEVVQ